MRTRFGINEDLGNSGHAVFSYKLVTLIGSKNSKKFDILEISNNREQATKIRRSVICKCQKSFPPVQVCVTMHKKVKRTNKNMIHDPIIPLVK